MRPSARTAGRAPRIDDIAEALPQRAATLSRLFLTRTSVSVSRTQAGMLWALALHPRRITELAAREHLTQPAISLQVNALEKRGWVERDTDPRDQRATLVKLTPEGRRVQERLRAEYRALTHEEMVTLSDDDLHALARAIEILDRLIERLAATPASPPPTST